MTKQEFIDELFDIIYGNHRTFTKEKYMIIIIDKFIKSIKEKSKKDVKNDKKRSFKI